MDPGSPYYDDDLHHTMTSEGPLEVIIKCISRIHDQMAVSLAVAVAVDCALRLRTFVLAIKNFCVKIP